MNCEMMIYRISVSRLKFANCEYFLCNIWGHLATLPSLKPRLSSWSQIQLHISQHSRVSQPVGIVWGIHNSKETRAEIEFCLSDVSSHKFPLLVFVFFHPKGFICQGPFAAKAYEVLILYVLVWDSHIFVVFIPFVLFSFIPKHLSAGGLLARKRKKCWLDAARREV